MLHAEQFSTYARVLETTFVPADQHREMLLSETSKLLDKHRRRVPNPVTSLAEVVAVIRNLTPQTVFDAICKRRTVSSEPEKVILLAVGRQLTSMLLSQEITFRQFVTLASDYDTTAYSYLKSQRVEIDPQIYVSSNPKYWDNLELYLFSFLTRYDFIDMRSSSSRYHERMSKALAL
jgi:hypothetical protein